MKENTLFNNTNKIIKESNSFRFQAVRVLYSLVFCLIYEGFFRKLSPSALSIVIFFIKDILCLYGLILAISPSVKSYLNDIPLSNLRLLFFMLFIPCVLTTNFHDPVIMLFGLKQYALYIVVMVLVPFAFPPEHIESFKKFLLFIAIMIFPTTLVAIVQSGLPATHWLNRAVDGGSLEGFSAGGYLRVSSTFAFNGQYSFFLNFVLGLLIVYICLITERKQFTIKQKILSVTLITSFIIGAFVTGGRTAVLGSIASLIVGSIIAVVKSPKIILLKGSMIVLLILGIFFLLKMVKPEYFIAYEVRSEGEKKYAEQNGGRSDFENRVTSGLFKWVDWYENQDTLEMILGNGIGVMSNGGDKLSSYAAISRTKFSVEGEMESVVWEGGLYLLLIWFSIKLYANVICIKLLMRTKADLISIGIAFLIGYTLVTSIYGQMSRQPPIAIYFWLSLGIIITLIRYSSFRQLNEVVPLRNNNK